MRRIHYTLAAVGAWLALAPFMSRQAAAQTRPYHFYYGNLHSHSSYSDGNQDSATSGYMLPRQDFAFADASLHLDFLGISEHNHGSAGMHRADYAKGLQQADSATVNGSFVALYGMEWGIIANGGHMLVYGVNELLGWETGNYDVFVGQHDYTQLFREINRRPGAFAMFAHPQSGDYNNLATASTPFSDIADSALVGSPMRSGPASSTTIDYTDASTGSYESIFNRMLAKGYHIGISLDHDNHKTTFGRTTPGRLVVLADTLTRPALLTALRNRRFFASDDWNAQVTLTLNGEPMGSILSGSGPVQIGVTVADEDLETARSITLMRGVPGSGTNAVAVATAPSGLSSITYTDTAHTTASYFYHVVVVQADGDRVVSSPVWYTRSTVSAVAATVEVPVLNVFPNPVAKGAPVNLTYFLHQKQNASLTVVDNLGRSVGRFENGTMQETGANGIRLETDGFAPGIYTVLLQQGQSQVRQKLIVE